MKRNGSILIFVLLTFMLITTGALGAIYMASEQLEIANNSFGKIQSQYLAESKINKIFYDDRYYGEQIFPSIMNHNDNRNPIYTLEKSDMFLDDNNRVNGRFYDLDGKRYLELSTSSEFKGITTQMKAYGTVFNDIFNDNNPALSYNTISKKDLSKFDDFMNEISVEKINMGILPNNIIGIELYDYEAIRMEKKNSNSYKIITKSFMPGEVEEETSFNNTQRVFICVNNPLSNNKAKFHIDDDLFFRGVLYIEGDLVITSPFWFLGVIIVKGDIIIDENLVKKPRIDGAILYDGELSLNDWDLRHNITYLNIFGIHIPNFIEPKLQVYKFMEGN